MEMYIYADKVIRGKKKRKQRGTNKNNYQTLVGLEFLEKYLFYSFFYHLMLIF